MEEKEGEGKRLACGDEKGTIEDVDGITILCIFMSAEWKMSIYSFLDL